MVSVVRVSANGHLVRVLQQSKASAGQPGNLPPDRNFPVAAARTSIDDAIHGWVDDAAKRYQVDPLLVRSVIRVESNDNPFAISPKGAQGLMQLIPATARRFGVADPFDARQNIEGGVRYLKYLQDRFSNDLILSIAAYNAGEGAVTKYKTVPPYVETLGYVQKVNHRYDALRTAELPATTESAALSTENRNDEPVHHVEQVIDSEGRLYLRTR